MSARIGLMFAFAAGWLGATAPEAQALIRGGEGNTPIHDPGWPAGAAVIFNTPARVAWWEGPPFGGGQWHAECRGDTRALSSVLADFAKIDCQARRVIVRDGVGRSFWLNPNAEPDKQDAAKIDWRFMVWQPESWKFQRRLSPDLDATNREDASDGPPAQLEIYTGGNIRWADVVVPDGLKVIDQRLEAHGFTVADGVVLEGKVTDIASKEAIAAKVFLQQVEAQKPGGYRYPVAAQTVAGADGHWVLKNVTAGWYRVVIDAEGYVPRIAGHLRAEQPSWQEYDTGMARAASLSGRVTDDAGRPLPEVDVRIGDVVAAQGGRRYESPAGSYTARTDADGRFEATQLPVGKATFWPHKSGYCRPGLGEPVMIPGKDIELRMIKAAHLVVTVDFGEQQRPGGYIVEMAPEGGNKVGSYGGSGNIDARNQMTFDNVPPGRYLIDGHPNPSSADQRTQPVTVELKGGETTELKLKAVGS